MARRFAVAAWTALVLAAAVGQAHAQASDDTICTDRPSRAAGACTVPAGHVQYEADIVQETFQHRRGVTVDSGFAAFPALKSGVSPTSDVELQFTPFAFQRIHPEGGKDRTAVGASDLTLRFKQNVLGGNDGDVQVALVPYLKAPTASRRVGGDRAWEGGGYVPVTFKLGPAWQLSLTPEFDVLKDEAGRGRHLQQSEVVSLTRTLPHDWSLYADMYGQWDFERHGATQSTLDFAVAKVLHRTLQLDCGVNLGLNRATPGADAYLGLSQRF